MGSKHYVGKLVSVRVINHPEEDEEPDPFLACECLLDTGQQRYSFTCLAFLQQGDDVVVTGHNTDGELSPSSIYSRAAGETIYSTSLRGCAILLFAMLTGVVLLGGIAFAFWRHESPGVAGFFGGLICFWLLAKVARTVENRARRRSERQCRRLLANYLAR